MKGRQQDQHMKGEKKKKKNRGKTARRQVWGGHFHCLGRGEEADKTKKQKYPKIPYLGTRDKESHRRQKGRGRDRRSQGVIRKSLSQGLK